MSVESSAASSALESWRLTSRASSDVLRFGENIERICSLEQQVKTLNGHVDVAKSKAKTAVDGETFILECMKNMSEQLDSKSFTSNLRYHHVT